MTTPMDMTELEKIAEIINNLGDKGLLAFIVWLAVDFGKTIICWSSFIVLFAVIFNRCRDAVVNSVRAASEAN